MTTKTITGNYATGFYLHAPYKALSITATGYVGGTGVYTPDGASVAYTLINDGTVKGASRGVYLSNGGLVTNGSASDAAASITGTKAGVDIAAANGVVANFGTISGAAGTAGVGVYLTAGGSVTNGAANDTKALIKGGDGVQVLNKAGTVANFGTIDGVGATSTQAGVYLAAGGRLTNGSTKDTGALIEGIIGVAAKTAAATVVNDGTISGVGGTVNVGVYLAQGGVVTNGAAGDTTALIQGSVGVYGKASVTVSNFGTIDGEATTIAPGGVYLKLGGAVTNGSASDTAALIEGNLGAVIEGAVGTIRNFGTIVGAAGTTGAGAALTGGGEIINGSPTDAKALIEGGDGIILQTKPGMVVNFGTIVAQNVKTKHFGVALNFTSGTITNFGTIISAASGTIESVGAYVSGGGRITNGGAKDTGALIQAPIAAAITGKAGTIINDGTLSGGSGASTFGAALTAGGAVINGAANDTTAVIRGGSGVQTTTKLATVSNFGTVEGLGTAGAMAGVYLMAGGNLTNGAAGDTSALIEGHYGSVIAGSGTLTNFGTIYGKGGDAVVFTAAAVTLAVEAGSRFIGAVKGDGGTLDLASGTGIITNLTGGNVTVAGSMPVTTFTKFGTMDVAGGAHFTLTGSGSIGAGGTSLVNLAGVLAVTGDLTTAGKMLGAGTLALQGGTTAFDAGTVLGVAHVAVSGTATQVGVATNITYAGLWTQTSGTLSVASGTELSFTGVGDGFSGAIAGAGGVAFTGGSDTLQAVTITAGGVVAKNASMTFEGAISLSTTMTATTPNLFIAAGGASLSGGGKIILTNMATNRLTGVAASATLTNVDDILQGAGQLGAGKMVLVNDTLGIINGNDTTALTIDTGSATIDNAGLIEATGAGGTNIQSAISNTGTLAALDGTLTVSGTVSGGGVVHISGGAADFASAFGQNVAFGATGVLELGQSQIYGATITGFSKTGANSLDLGDIVFHAGTTKASYSGTASSGVLTVTDGVHTAKIKLSGDYLGSVFTPSSDGHGGTKIVDPQKGSGNHAPSHFAAAMATFAAPGLGQLALTREAWTPVVGTLARPAPAIS